MVTTEECQSEVRPKIVECLLEVPLSGNGPSVFPSQDYNRNIFSYG